MSSRGVVFSLTREWESKLLEMKDDDSLVNYIVEVIEKKWDKDWLADTDKAWDAIQRCFSKGQLDSDVGRFPLNCMIMGGKMLNRGDSYVVYYKDTRLVLEISKALRDFDMRNVDDLYAAIGDDYGDKSSDDLQYTKDWLQGVIELYRKSATASRSVIFTIAL